jgi:hypothetical protein
MEIFLYFCVNFKFENMKKKLFFLLFLAIGLNSCEKAIETPEQVKGFIQGKWHDETVGTGGLITYYRFEITDTEIRCWKSNLILSDNGRASDNITIDWAEQTPVPLSIGSVQMKAGSSSKYDKAIRTLGNCNYGTYTFEYSEGLGNMLVFKDITISEDDYHSGKLDRGWEY